MWWQDAELRDSCLDERETFCHTRTKKTEDASKRTETGTEHFGASGQRYRSEQGRCSVAEMWINGHFAMEKELQRHNWWNAETSHS